MNLPAKVIEQRRTERNIRRERIAQEFFRQHLPAVPTTPQLRDQAKRVAAHLLVVAKGGAQ